MAKKQAPQEDFPVATAKFLTRKAVRATDKATDTLLTNAATKAINDLIFKGNTARKGLEPIERQANALEAIAHHLEGLRDIMLTNSGRGHDDARIWRPAPSAPPAGAADGPPSDGPAGDGYHDGAAYGTAAAVAPPPTYPQGYTPLYPRVT